MKNIFQSEELFKQISENGFAVIDLLTEHDIHKLTDIYKSYEIEIPEHFYSTSFIADENIRKKISIEIQEIIRPKVKQLLKKSKELGAVFLIKPYGPNTEMPLHQDWTVAEEPQHHTFTFWIPIQDTTAQNGAITVLPKSHLLSTALRSPSLIDSLKDIKEIAAPMMETLEMKAGQAFVFTHALLHASHTNLSEKNRVAIAYGVTHQETKLIYYHKPQNRDIVQKLSIPSDFFISYPEPGKPPVRSTIIEEFEYKPQIIKQEDFKSFYKLHKESIWKKAIHFIRRK